jgi:hypothetical protein
MRDSPLFSNDALVLIQADRVTVLVIIAASSGKLHVSNRKSEDHGA